VKKETFCEVISKIAIKLVEMSAGDRTIIDGECGGVLAANAVGFIAVCGYAGESGGSRRGRTGWLALHGCVAGQEPTSIESITVAFLETRCSRISQNKHIQTSSIYIYI
jgi:hypothetical protein